MTEDEEHRFNALYVLLTQAAWVIHYWVWAYWYINGWRTTDSFRQPAS